MEIERKFLMPGNPFDLTGIPSVEISQSYISFMPTLRIRKQDDKYIFTAKSRGHMAKEEFEVEVSYEEYESLRKKVDGYEISKTRYFIPLKNGLTGEFDIYHGSLKGLYTIEVEFSTEAEANLFIAPDWFGEDVTMKKRYKNSWLAEFGNQPHT